MTEAINVLLIGRPSIEFRGINTELRRLQHAGELVAASGFESITRSALPERADLVIVLLEFPDQFSWEEISTLLNRYPLAQLMVCLGTWCDSIGRTRDKWPMGVQVRAELAIPRLHRELAVLRGESDPLPLTASRDETFAFDTVDLLAESAASRRVCILSNDPDMQGWLATAIGSFGHGVVSQNADHLDLAIVDVDPFEPERVSSLVKRMQRDGQVPVLAISSMLHEDQRRQLDAVGVSGVISKLTPLHALAEAIDAAAHDQSLSIPSRHS